MSDITVGAPVYAIAVLILATLAAVLVKRQGKRD